MHHIALRAVPTLSAGQRRADHDPGEKYGLEISDCINETCPWSGEPVQADSLTEFNGQVVGFCNPGCRDKFVTALRHFETAKASITSP